MDGMIYCLVDANGEVYIKDGAVSHSEVVEEFGLNESTCEQYRFDLTHRRLVGDRATPLADRTAHRYLDHRLGTPERLMRFAVDGHLSKDTLAGLLAVERRPPYLRACATIEKTYTEECTGRNDPRLESGCALEGEICLQPLVKAGSEYQKACAAEWISMFRSSQNRIDVWKN
jgi:hypothetical protein